MPNELWKNESRLSTPKSTSFYSEFNADSEYEVLFKKYCGQKSGLTATCPLLDAMSEAIENSAVFLLCLTEKYKDSPSCRLGMIIRNRTVFSQAKLIYRENS